MDIDSEYNQSVSTESNCGTPNTPVLEFQRTHHNNEFRLKGRKNPDNSIALTLRIADLSGKGATINIVYLLLYYLIMLVFLIFYYYLLFTYVRYLLLAGRVRNIHFQFYLDTDTAHSVASEMVEQLELANHDVAFIAEFIDYLIKRIMPGWKPLSQNHSSAGRSTRGEAQAVQPTFIQNSWDTVITGPPAINAEQDTVSELTSHHSVQVDEGKFFHNSVPLSHVEQHAAPNFTNMEDKESQASVVSEVMGEDVALKNEQGHDYVGYVINGVCKGSSGHDSELDFRDLFYDDMKMQENHSVLGEGIQVEEFSKNREVTLADVNGASKLDGVSNVMSLTSNCSYLSLTDDDQDLELKLELDAIEAQYQHWFEELVSSRDEAIKTIRNRWMTKKNSTMC